MTAGEDCACRHRGGWRTELILGLCSDSRALLPASDEPAASRTGCQFNSRQHASSYTASFPFPYPSNVIRVIGKWTKSSKQVNPGVSCHTRETRKTSRQTQHGTQAMSQYFRQCRSMDQSKVEVADRGGDGRHGHGGVCGGEKMTGLVEMGSGGVCVFTGAVSFPPRLPGEGPTTDHPLISCLC